MSSTSTPQLKLSLAIDHGVSSGVADAWRQLDVGASSTMLEFSPPAPACRRKAVKRSEGYTPRPPNAWILYRSQQLRMLKQDSEISKRPQSDISKLIGHMWREENLEVRKWYELEAEVKKLEHREKYPNYRFCPVRKDRPTTDSGTPLASATCIESVLSDEQPRKLALVLSASANLAPRKRVRATSGPSTRRRAVSSEPPFHVLPPHPLFAKQLPYKSASPTPTLSAYPSPVTPKSSASTYDFGGDEEQAAHDAWAAFETSTPQWFPLPLSSLSITSHFSFAAPSSGVLGAAFSEEAYSLPSLSRSGTGEGQSNNYSSPLLGFGDGFEGEIWPQALDYVLGSQDIPLDGGAFATVALEPNFACYPFPAQ